jgi:hypothetical protein
VTPLSPLVYYVVTAEKTEPEWTVHRKRRNPYRSDTKEKVPEDLPKRKKGQEGTDQGKRFSGRKRNFENDLKVLLG